MGAVWPNSYYEGRWQEGETLRFISPDGTGTLAQLTEHRPPEYIRAVHVAALLKGGVEDRDSTEARDWVSTTKAYTLTEKDGRTELQVDMEMHPRWEVMFVNDWPRALAKLKEVCER
jgi:hypothetical protein